MVSTPAAGFGQYEVILVMLVLAYRCTILGWLWADVLCGPDLRCPPAADVTLLVEGELTLEESRELWAARISSLAKTGAIDSFSKHLTICYGA